MPLCGVIYAKARHDDGLAPPPPPPTAASTTEAKAHPRDTWDSMGVDTALEFKLRVAAVPLALFVAWFATKSGIWHFLGRAFLSMWVHETGHALTAWLCAFGAIPGPWFTPIWETRSIAVGIIVTGGIGYMMYHGLASRQRWQVLLGATLLVLQITGTLVLDQRNAREFIILGGDAGCLVLGTLLMASFYTGPESGIHRTWLRWGFLVIGAFSFMDVFEQWWASRTDFDRIPFGANEGSVMSDPSRLVEDFGMTPQGLTRIYVTLGIACMLFLTAIYILGLYKAHRERSEAPRKGPAL